MPAWWRRSTGADSSTAYTVDAELKRERKMEIMSLPTAFRSDDAIIECYISIPVVPSPCPGVLVLSERYGMVEYIKDVTRRLAREG